MIPNGNITVLLVEDHEIVRQGLCVLLAADGHNRIIGQARTGREAVQLAASLQPDIILMDIAMPELNGLEATRQILAAKPAAKVIILSAHSEEIYVDRMIEAGVVGFIEKRMSAEYLTKAIHEVTSGRNYYSPAIARRLLGSPEQQRSRVGPARRETLHLSSRENEVLQLVAEGLGNKQIGGTLGISVKTVEKHRQRVMDKLNIHETAGLTRYAISAGIISNPTIPSA